MMESTSHSVWANTLALQRAGITDGVRDGNGRLYMRNRRGRLNGILFEDAGESLGGLVLVLALLLKVSLVVGAVVFLWLLTS